MPIAVEPVTTFQELDDGPGPLTAVHDGLVPQWSDAAQRFVMVRLPAPGQVHVAGGGGGVAQMRDLLDVQGQLGPASDGYGYLYNAALDKFILSEISVFGETPASILAKLLTVDGAGSGLDADTLDSHNTDYFATADHTHTAGDADTLDGHDSSDFVLVTDYEDADVLAKIKNVDGTGSGLDADTLDGNDSSAFAAAGHSHALTDLSDVDITPGAGVDGYSVVYDDGSGNFILADVTGGGGYTNEQAQDAVGGILTDTDTINFTYDDAGNQITADVKDGSITATKLADGAALAEILDDDGAGSGLDADLLDGNEATAFAAASHTHTSGDVTDFDEAAQDAVGGMIADTATIDLTYTDATPELKADVKADSIDNTLLANMAQTTIKGRADGAGTGDPTDLSAAQVLAIVKTVDGASSGLDADLLDGNEASAFAAASHVHAGEDITSGTVADARIASTITRDSEVFGIVLAADGSGSGLDADLLDGNEASAFAAASHTHTSGDVTDFDEAAQDAVGGMIADTATIDLTYTDATPELKADVKVDSIDNTLLANMAQATVKGRASGAGTGDPTDLTAAQLLAIVETVDGTGSGLDADTLDGNEASAFAAASHTHDASDITAGTLDDARIPSGVTRDSEVFGIVLANDGSGSGLDADTLDGNDSAAFAAAGHTHEVDQRSDMFSDAEGDPANVAGAAADGTSTYAARRDHVHTIAAGTVTATMLQDGAALAEILDDDGADSGLDADLLDGNEASAFAAASHAHTSSDITDFAEAAQDAVGAALSDSETLEALYDDDNDLIGFTLKDGVVTNTKLRDSVALSVIGRSVNSTGSPADIPAGNDGEVLRRSGTALGFGTVATAGIANDAVTYAKLQNISATDRLLGRDTTGAGDAEELTVGGGLEFTGSGGIQRSALTGDVTASAGSNTTAIATDAVTNTQLANMAQATIKGRASGAGTGDPTDLTAAQAAAIVQASVDHGSVAGLADDDHTQYLLATGARTGATSQPQQFTYNPIAPWWDFALNDATNGNHFNDNTSTYPAGWTEIDAPKTVDTNTQYGSWFLIGDSSNTAWDYKKQSGIDIENDIVSNQWASFKVGPIFRRDGIYTADLDYYFGIYRDNSGIDANTFVRANLHWNSASSKWQIRMERKDGTTQTNSTYFDLTTGATDVPIQPIWIRLVARNNSGTKTVRVHVSITGHIDRVFTQLDSANLGAITWGDVWWRFNMSRGAGVEDYLFLGGIDCAPNSP